MLAKQTAGTGAVRDRYGNRQTTTGARPEDERHKDTSRTDRDTDEPATSDLVTASRSAALRRRVSASTAGAQISPRCCLLAEV